MYYLYRITNILNNKVYIGQSNKENERWRQHRYFAKNPEKTGQYIHRAMNKYGVENFVYEVVAMCKTQEDMDETEKLLIQQYDSQNEKCGYNIAPGGDPAWNRGLPTEQQPMYGKKQSEYFKLRMLEIHVGSAKPQSDEHKEKISKSLKGHIVSEETKMKISKKERGKIISVETKTKMSKSKLGKRHRSSLNEEQVNEIRNLLNNGNSTKDIATKYGVRTYTIQNIKSGRTWKL